MSSFNEIVAIKSLGISPMLLIWPSLTFAALVSLAGVAINDLAVSWGVCGVSRVVQESIEQLVYGQLRLNHTMTQGKFTITAREVDGHKLRKAMIVQQPSSKDGAGELVIAEEAELQFDAEEGTLTIVGHNCEVEGQISGANPEEMKWVMTLDGFGGTSSQIPSPSNCALREIGPAIQDEVKHVDAIEQSSTAAAGFALLTGDFDALSDTTWQAHERELTDARHRLQRLYTEPWRRWANGFSCLCFVLIGAPMAIRLRHAEFLASFFACFLPILVVYYPLMAVSVSQAKDGSVPPPAVWFGNVVLAAWGVWLMRRVIRY
jgi:lipopolysaccharide export system permease protein